MLEKSVDKLSSKKKKSKGTKKKGLKYEKYMNIEPTLRDKFLQNHMDHIRKSYQIAYRQY